MKVLFVGLLYNPQKEEEYINHSKIGISVASNLYQWNTIRGLVANGIDVEVIGSIPYGCYPELSDKAFVRDEFYLLDDIKLTQFGYINFYWIKHLFREYKIKAYIKKWVKKNQGDSCIVLFYDIQKIFLRIIQWLKIFKNVKSSIIVPDLAGELRNDVGIKGIKGWLLNKTAYGLLSSSSCADSYILLTNQMNDIVNTKSRPYTVIDGIVDDEKKVNIKVPNKRVIMYAGNLSSQYRISQLLSVFKETKNDNLELWFCGKGDEEKNIVEASKIDSRIKYLGFVSKKELEEIEKSVCFYINPRINNGEYTKYSFPSKNLEYLLAGKPVIAYKLDGMSEDYDDIFLYLSEDGDDSIKRMFRKLAEMSDDEIVELSKMGAEFVKKHNGKKNQGLKVIKLFEGLFDEN